MALSTGEPILLRETPKGKFRGTRLPGSILHEAAGGKDFVFSYQYFQQPPYQISYRNFQANHELRINTRESFTGLRLELVLSGTLSFRTEANKEYNLSAGQYHITTQARYQSFFAPGAGVGYLSVYLPGRLLESIGITESIEPCEPRLIPPVMKDIAFEMLDNPYSRSLLPIYYENRIRDLLFTHISMPPFTLPGDLTVSDLAAIYESDRIISENLGDHLTINAIARKAGTNAHVLKKGFQQVFGVGVFGRLLQLRMDRAKYLLANTNAPIKDICEEAGYETVAGFITAFRKRFGLTPKDWRKRERGIG